MIDADPIVLTERTRMRPHRPDDFENVFSLWSDPAVTRYISGDPMSRELVWMRFLRMIGHWSVLGYGFWIVEDRETGGFIGEVGFGSFKRDTDPSFADTPELGWVLRSEMHGRGLASETVGAALTWADRHFDGDRTVCIVSEKNTASIRVADKVGFTEYARSNYHTKPIVFFQRFRPI